MPRDELYGQCPKCGNAIPRCTCQPIPPQPASQARELAGFTIEHAPIYYIADNGELRPYENHGLPGDELLCKFSDVRELERAISALSARETPEPDVMDEHVLMLLEECQRVLVDVYDWCDRCETRVKPTIARLAITIAALKREAAAGAL